MSSEIAIGATVNVPSSGQIVYLVGESQPEQLAELLASYLGRPEVERVVLLAASPAAAAQVAAPHAAQRDAGRLATVLILDDLPGALRAARRGWGEPDVLIRAPGERWSVAAALSYAAD